MGQHEAGSWRMKEDKKARGVRSTGLDAVKEVIYLVTATRKLETAPASKATWKV